MTEALPTTDLLGLARTGDIDALEGVWSEAVATPGELGTILEVLQVLIETGQTDRAGKLGAELLNGLASSGRTAEIGAAIERMVGHVESLNGCDDALRAWLKETHGSEDWFEHVAQKAGVELESLDWNAMGRLWAQLAYAPGRVILHGSGWGEGQIAEILAETDEIVIQFASGRRHTVPWQTALDTMQPLTSWDIRAMRLLDPESLLAAAKAQPLEILRRTLKIFRGKANAAQLKEQLHERVIPAKNWATWWKKAKAAAIEDPLIAVEGSSTRPVLTLRKKALSLAEEAQSALRHERQVPKILSILRTFFDRATRDQDRAELGELARGSLGGLAASPHPDADNVLALVFLDEIGQAPDETMRATLRAFFGAQGDDDAGFDLRRLASIDDAHVRVRVAGWLPKVLSDRWAGVVAAQLTRLPEHCDASLEALVEALREANANEELVGLHESAAPFPKKHPFLLYLLTKAYAEGALAGASRSLDASICCRVIIHALRAVTDLHSKKRNKVANRIVTLLTGKRALLQELLDGSDQKTIESIVKVARSGGDDFPPKVHERIENFARETFPEIFEEAPKPFWEEDDAIYVTRKGFESYEAEFHHLRDELIPANSKAIGAAASLGDLSENAEWEAAMEEQRNLTARARVYEDNLKLARFLEEVDVPEGVAAPGTRVRYKELGEDAVKEMRILGPWDGVHGEDVVSYQAPLAKGVLGCAAGEQATITLPGRTIEVEVIGIEPIF